MAGKTYNYSSTHRALEIAAICVFAVFAIANAKLIVEAIDGPLAVAVLLGALVTGYLCADLISGTVHWLADRFGTVETPLFGANFIVPFRRHHVYPKEITEHDFIETNGNNCIVSFWILPLAYFGFPPAAGAPGGLFLFATVEATILAVMATNQFHKWAHQDVPPRFVQVLQRLHLVLPPDHHDIHHTAPFDTYFCITTGWLNWPLRKLRVFEALEWTIARVLGIKAGEDDQKTLAQVHAPPPGVATPAAS